MTSGREGDSLVEEGWTSTSPSPSPLTPSLSEVLEAIEPAAMRASARPHDMAGEWRGAGRQGEKAGTCKRKNNSQSASTQ